MESYKPRIVRTSTGWRCLGLFASATGATPQAAYLAWERYEEKARRMYDENDRLLNAVVADKVKRESFTWWIDVFGAMGIGCADRR